MLYVLLTIIHILVCIFLSLVVLLQSGKGQDLASSFGGGSSQTVFGSAGPATALSKATSVSAVIFMLTSLGLAILSTQSRSVMDSAPIPQSPAAVATPLPAEHPGDSGGASQGAPIPAAPGPESGASAPAPASGSEPESAAPAPASGSESDTSAPAGAAGGLEPGADTGGPAPAASTPAQQP
jgi:preprotein translocase subunit SecG